MLSLLLVVCGLSSAPLGSMEQAPERGSAAVSIPLTEARESKVGVARVGGDDRSPTASCPGNPSAEVRCTGLVPNSTLALVVGSAPAHGGLELAALLGFRATAPPDLT